MKEMHFKDKEAYRKWLAFGNIRTNTGLKVQARSGRESLFKSTPGNSKIFIGGKSHIVKHGR